jgi:hypothetical protein
VETAEPTAAVESHGGRCHGDCRRHYGRGKAPEQFGLHDSDPPQAIPEFSSIDKDMLTVIASLSETPGEY